MPQPPIAKRIVHRHEAHGQVREDPYYWMRDDDREDAEILAHLAEENRYADAMLAPQEQLREQLFEEIVGRIPQDDSQVPVFHHGYWYYSRVEQGKEYSILCRRRETLEAPEEIYLDANAEAEGHAFYSLGGASVSRNGEILAYSEDTLSRRIYTLRFRSLQTGETLPDVVEGIAGGAVWASDNRTVFYVKREEGTLRAYQVWRHALGTPASEDVLVFEENDSEFYVSVGLSKSEEYILIGSHQTVSNEYRYLPAAEPTAAPVVVLSREAGHEHSVDHIGERFVIRTNWQAQNFRLMSVSPERSQEKENWREEIAGRDDILLEGCELFERWAVCSERREGLSRLRVYDWSDEGQRIEGEGYEIDMPEAAYNVSIGRNPSAESEVLRFGYESMTTPPSVFDYSLTSRDRELRKVQQVPNFDAANYEAQRLMVPARDGTRVPVSIVYRRDLDRSQPQPLMLYGYGSYGYSMEPSFSSTRLSLLDRGFVWAIAHVRGGQEMGRQWYDDGKLMAKMHTFEDFIDVADHLVAEGWTNPEKLFAMGGSAGGLLMGAVTNLRPELWRGIVANVPFVDVVTTMLDETIPLTTFEYDEWGNPNEQPAYEYMMRYSPYDNIGTGAYPAMLVLTGLHDSQVQYWEPAKWVARLRHRTTGDEPILFRVNMEAGHGGASGRFRRHRETALIFAWLLSLTGE